MAFVPVALMLAGALKQGMDEKSRADDNANFQAAEGNVARGQATVAEGFVRRNSREALGRQIGAFGAAGTGYGGSSGTALKQSAVNQEMDALTTRYKGVLTGWGYNTQANLDKRHANEAMQSGVLMAGAQAIKSAYGGTFSYAPKDDSLAQGGTTSAQSNSP